VTLPVRLPDAASLETVLAGLDPALADAALVPALARTCPGFEFSLARIDDDWRNTRSVIRPDGTRLGELRPWMTAELAKEHGDIAALWRRLKKTELQITDWRGTRAFVFAPTGPATAHYIQIALGRKSEWRAGPVVNPDYHPFRDEELLDPSWIRRDDLPETARLTHGHWVDPDVGLAIAAGLRAQRVRLPDRDAAVLLRWADQPYGF
jgi:hypothetical protein